MKYYSSVKKNETMNFVGEWIEHTILSEVTQTNKCCEFSYFKILVPNL